jgi:hypothetical protein
MSAGPPVLVTHSAAGDDYRETGRCDDEVDVDDPVRVPLRPADLLSRGSRRTRR